VDKGFDASSERTAGIGFKPVRLMYLPGDLCLWMQKALKTPALKQNPRNPRLTKDLTLYICRESSTNPPFFAKQTQFPAFMAQKQRFAQKTNPIQTQINPIFGFVSMEGLI
jgi:hypothetical protein